MRFAQPEYLWFLLVLPLLIVYLLAFREKDIPAFKFPSLSRLEGLSRNLKETVGFYALGGLRAAAVTLLVLALARPQRGLRSEEMTAKAADILLCLDASRSMLTIDFKPDNRYQAAKSVIREFIQGRDQDRIGLVLFAEYAITQCPLTTDKNALLNILDFVQVGVIAPDRTAIGVGLATSVNRLKNSKAKSKVIILLTDGANNAGSVDPLTAAKTAESFGIKIYTIGAGTTEGGLMPVNDPVFGQRMVPVKSDLDEDMLLKIATETLGKYFRAKSPDALKTIFKEIDALEKTDIKIREYVDYQEYFPWMALFSALLLLVELALAKTKYRTFP